MPAKKAVPGPSDQARTFLLSHTTPVEDLSPENLPDIRTAGLAEMKPFAGRVKRRLKLKTKPIDIAGVPCLEITPPVVRDERTILYMFGGGYVVGGPTEDLPISGSLGAYAQARVISPAYRLAPEHPYPAAVDDGFAVYKELINRVPAGGLAIAGESAGGGAALAILQRARADGILHPAACALLSPWCELADMGSMADMSLDPTFAPGNLERYAEYYAAEHDRLIPEISPTYGHYDESFPPTVITTGTHDKLLSQVCRLAQVMRRGGMSVDLRVWEDLWHVFEYYEGIPEADLSLREIAAFLDDHFV